LYKDDIALKCSNLLGVPEATWSSLAGSALEAGAASRRFFKFFSGLSSGSEAEWTSSAVSAASWRPNLMEYKEIKK
jgi:hypothetical protein